MDELAKNSKLIRQLCRFFIITGLVEIVFFILITANFFFIIPGLITIIPAFLTLNKDTVRRKYFVGIWPLIKYNPFGVALISFLLGDLLKGRINIFLSELFFYSFIVFFIIGISSVVCGIILIVKISKHNKLIKLNII